MPIDFLKEQRVYRIDVQKYEDSEELDLDNLVRHIFKSEKKGILFAFDVTKPRTYERYVKKALERMLQFTQENVEKEFRMPPPFVLLGMKADLEAHVADSDVLALVLKLRQYKMRCAYVPVSAESGNGVIESIETLLHSVDSEHIF